LNIDTCKLESWQKDESRVNLLVPRKLTANIEALVAIWLIQAGI